MNKKLVIFDLDGTLYNLDDVVPMYYSMEVDFIEKYYHFDRNQAEEFLNKNGVLPYRTENAKSATDLFINSGIPIDVWTKYREEFFDSSCIHPEYAAKEEDIVSFLDFSDIVLLSSNTYKNICNILSQININKDIFSMIVCSDQSLCKGRFSKEEAMMNLSLKYGVDYPDLYSVGDRYQTDIVPILNLKGNGILIKDPLVLKDIAKDFMDNELGKSEKYRFFKGSSNE